MFQKSIAVVTLVAVMIMAASVTALTDSALAQQQKFAAKLSGQEVVPPTNSQATGSAEFTVAGQSIEYTVNASNIQGATAGHLYLGTPGENGLIIATLFENDSPTNEVSESGSITSDTGAFEYITDLTTPMSDGETYVSINTVQNPDGEIRGKITSSDEGQ